MKTEQAIPFALKSKKELTAPSKELCSA